VEARRKQVLSQLSNKIISELKKEPPEKGTYAKELHSQKGLNSELDKLTE